MVPSRLARRKLKSENAFLNSRMLGLKVSYDQAEKVKQYLLERDLFEKDYLVDRQADGIIFPVKREFSAPWDFDVDFVPLTTGRWHVTGNLRDVLEGHLTQEENEALRVSYDIVGSIAIIEIPPALEPKQKLVGEKLMEINGSVKTVLKKASAHEGEFRTQQMECIAGEDVRETIVVENGVRLKVDVEDAYYSIRMATERKRILEMIRAGENILCLFSGVAPYPVVFSKHSPAAAIMGVEINPKAHELAQENVAKNRCMNVHLVLGDAHDVLRKLSEEDESYDRITMPLPHTADEFLDDVLRVCKRGAVIHFYCFAPEGSFENEVKKLRQIIERAGYSLGSYHVEKVGQYAPRVWRLCIDLTLR